GLLRNCLSGGLKRVYRFKYFTSADSAAMLNMMQEIKPVMKRSMTMDVKFPIGQLDVPENVTLDSVEEWLDQIENYTLRLRGNVDSPSDADVANTFRGGSFDVRQRVHHIADSQRNMYQRLELALTEDAPRVPGFVQDEWAVLPDTEIPVESSVKML